MHAPLPPQPGSAHPAARPDAATPLAARLPLTLRLSLRELRGGLRGFGIFLACLILGVWAIAAVGSLSRALTEGLAREGRTLLGADMAFALVQRQASPEEREFLARQGTLATVATMRAMVQAGEKGSALVELKAVDGLYPTIGRLLTEPQGEPADLLARRGEAFGAVADPALLARLDLRAGDTVRLGTATLVIAASLTQEPDRIAGGVGFGPRLLVSQDALAASGLQQPGSLVRWTYRLILPEGAAGDAAIERVKAAAEAGFPQAGWDIRTRLNADGRFARNIERFAQFLALVGLTALAIGGVGVANAVKGFVDRKRESIAVMKSLGAPGGQVVAVHLTQVLLIALFGIAIGLGLGALTPVALAGALDGISPIPLVPAAAPEQWALAALYGLAMALAFALPPLGRAHDVPVAALFRDRVAPDRRRPRAVYLVGAGLALALIVAATLGATDYKAIAAGFLAASAGAFLALRLAGAGLMRLARALPRPRRPLLRLALANLHRPAAATPALTLSLGLSVTLLTVIAMADVNLTRNLRSSLPDQAPNFFFLDIPSTEAARFDAAMTALAPGAKLERVPLMRGRIVSVKGVPASQVKAADNIAWVLDGDRGLTFSATLPEGSTIESGQWWPADYAGPPLVSFEEEAAKGLGLAVGDRIVVGVLGRTIEVTVASLRDVEWRSLGINFVMVFSPNTFAGAPHTNLATVTLPPGASNAATEGTIIRDLGRAFPTVTAIRVREAVEAVNDVVGKIMLAVRGASAVVLVASLLVLGGAVAAGHRARLYDAVVLKTLGATRAKLMGAYALEYAIAGACAALVGLLAGTLAAAFVVTGLMKLSFAPAWPEALAAALAAIAAGILLGLAGSWRALGQKPARHLRAE